MSRDEIPQPKEALNISEIDNSTEIMLNKNDLTTDY